MGVGEVGSVLTRVGSPTIADLPDLDSADDNKGGNKGGDESNKDL